MARYQASEREARYRTARHWGLPPVVTEGDSWFSYELYLNLVDRIDDTKRFALKRLESSGDTLKRMVGHTPGASGVRALKQVIQAERPVFLFFSGGGNDIVGPELAGALRPYDPRLQPREYLDTPAWRALVGALRTGYDVLVGEIGRICPVFAHGYDYFVPSDRAVKIFPGIKGPGPWVFPEMTRSGVGITDPALQRRIARAMIDEFNDGILAQLERAHAGAFVHVDLRKTLDPERDWQNEIHPTRAGFDALARRFLEQLDRKLPAVRKARAAWLGGTIA
jgi:hypothetical protein